MTKLEAVRELLLPALRMHEKPDLKLECEIDYSTGNLLVKGTYTRKYELGFCISKNAIETRTYLEQFTPALRDLVHLLESNDEDFAIAARPPKDENNGASA